MPRVFTAIALPDSLREALAALRVDDPGVRWVRPEGMHLTVRFLGNTDAVDDVIAALLPVAARTPRLSLGLAGFGRFPPRRAPRVLWVGVTGDVDPLADLADRVNAALAPVGFTPETPPYHAHVTLGRVKHGGATAALSALDGLGALGEFAARELILYRSDLSPKGATYTALAELPFGAHVRDA